jgi:serine/threonine protein kinase
LNELSFHISYFIKVNFISIFETKVIFIEERLTLTFFFPSFSRYLVLDILGQGTFGQVVKCRKIGTDQLVAIKIVKNKRAYFNQGLVETKILEQVNNNYILFSFSHSCLKHFSYGCITFFSFLFLFFFVCETKLNKTYDPENKNHIVRLYEHFNFRHHLCLVFELLSINLYELLKQNHHRGLTTVLIRVFLQQILEALIILSQAKVIHCDLKPENILLTR